MTDHHDDAAVRRLLEQYNPPPDLPAESLWAAIEKAEAGLERGSYTSRMVRLPAPWAAAAALALFALGIGAGAALTRAPSSAVDAMPVAIEEVGGAEQDTKVVIWF